MLARKLSGAVVLALVLAVVGTGDLRAQPKYNRKTREIKVTATEATKKLEAKKNVAPAERQKDITADQYMQVQEAVQEITEELIKIYKEQLENAEDDDPRRPEYAFRLAEAYAQNVRFHNFKKMEALMKADKAKNKSEKSKWIGESKKEEKNEQKWLVDTVKIYQTIVDNKSGVFKKFGRMDEVYFYYAFTLRKAGYTDQALAMYKRLLKEFQTSKFIPDAYLAFAEYYFEQKDMSEAGAHYDKVLKFPKSSVYPYAMYMKGWVFFNLNQPDDAMKAFYDTVQLTNNDAKNQTMNRAAKKDFVRMYAEVGDVKLAYKAFERVDTKYAFTMLGFLGDFYVDQGKADKAIYVFRQMIDMQPTDKRVCEWQVTVTRAMLTIGNQEQKVKEIGNTDKLYAHLRDGKVIPEANLAECVDNARSMNSELAKLWHVEGLKTLNPDTLAYAHALYKLYQTYFPDADDAAEMQFYYAELVWKRAEMEKNQSKQAVLWEEAAAEHRRVVEMQAVDKDLLKESALATVLAWKNALAIDPATDVPEDDPKSYAEVPKPVPIPEKEQKMMAAFDVYLTYVKDRKDEERILITFFKGRIYWKYKHFDEALPLLEEVVTQHPDHEVAEPAANILLDSLNRAHKYDELIAWVDKLLAMEKFLAEHTELQTQVTRLKRQALRKDAEQKEKDKRYRECGVAYQTMYERYANTGGDDLPEILYNASVCYEQAKLIGRAIRFRQVLVSEYPKNPLAQKAQFALGQNYSQIAWYDKAAEMFEKYAKDFAGEPNAAEALGSATFLRKGLGQDDKAIKDTEDFIKKFRTKKVKEAAQAHYSMASIYEKNKAWDQYKKHLSNYLREWGTKGGVDRQIVAHVKIAEVLWRESCPVKGVNGACIETRREGRAMKQARKGKKKVSAIQTQCGDMSKTKVIVHERKPGIAKEAKVHLNTALKLWKGGEAAKDVPGKDDQEKAFRTAEAIQAVAQAKFILAEEDFESFLTINFPDKLDFDPEKKAKKKESEKRFLKYMADKSKALDKAATKYKTIVENALEGGASINGAAWAIAASARYGQLFQNFADQIWTSEIPKDVRTGEYAEDKVAAYCDTLADGFRDEQGNLLLGADGKPIFAGVNVVDEQSINGFSFCLKTSTDLNWFNDWTKFCEGELAQIRPQDYPTAGEIRAKPDQMPITLDTQPIAEDLADASKKTTTEATPEKAAPTRTAKAN